MTKLSPTRIVNFIIPFTVAGMTKCGRRDPEIQWPLRFGSSQVIRILLSSSQAVVSVIYSQ